MEEKKIFDKKFVHFMWDDSLKGKEGFVASTIRLIIDCVENNVRTNHWQKLEESRSTDLPFHSITGMDYGFAYCDPLYEVKLAWKQGKQIQTRVTNSRGDWVDLDNPNWEFVGYDYRVKPEKKWRPFNSMEELRQAWSTKLTGRTDLVLDYDLTEPMIWVRSKSNTTSTYMITHYCGNMGEIYLCGYLNMGLVQLFDDYTFLDGTPCGVKE